MSIVEYLTFAVDGDAGLVDFFAVSWLPPYHGKLSLTALTRENTEKTKIENCSSTLFTIDHEL